MVMKTLFNTLKPVFSDKVNKIFKDAGAYKELLSAIDAEREGDKEPHTVTLNGVKLKLVRVK
jgi:hypothetical protein